MVTLDYILYMFETEGVSAWVQFNIHKLFIYYHVSDFVVDLGYKNKQYEVFAPL